MSDAPSRGRRLRILLHAQHLTGVGHFVRMREIARALARRHEVHIVDAGRPVPGAGLAGAQPLRLPRIARRGQRLVPLAAGLDLEAVLDQRRRILTAAIGELRPDVLLIEHYPFSKWELQTEIETAILAARHSNARVRIVCSVRDIPRQTRHEDCSGAVYVQRVLHSLHAGFDALLVHGDPALTRLEQHFPGAGELRIPVEYTGIVSESPRQEARGGRVLERLTGGAPFALASAGGGPDPQGLLAQCITAWQQLVTQPTLSGWRLVVCAGLAAAPETLQTLARQPGSESVVVQPFSADYLSWLATAALSVSCAGYNTCANLLQLGCRAVLVPNPQMSDQPERARLLAAHGIVTLVDAERLDADTLAAAMRAALAGPPPQHTIAIDGAERTRAILERLAG